jgi:hypothetical protein
MAIAMFMEWDGVTAAQYDAVRALVNWEGEPPTGGILHVATATDAGLRIADVWESAESFQTFVEQRLMPGVKSLGLPGEPRVEILSLHAVFVPGLARD